MKEAASLYEHPRDELVQVMSRMYSRHLTTSSGGNASVVDNNGVVWMTPKGNDKGALSRDEIAYKLPGERKWKGSYPPSSEWPFHTRIYEARKDVKAILHAHSQTLVAFSVANQLPNTLCLSQAAYLCGNSVGLAPYAMPGTDALADTIAEHIVKHDCLIMANHGVVVVGKTMLEAYQKFEALEFCARAEVRSRVLGGDPLLLSTQDQLAQNRATEQGEKLCTLQTTGQRPPVTTNECNLRALLVKYVKRSYSQGLIHSTSGAMSAKLTDQSFLITPSGEDRHSIRPEDIILVTFQKNSMETSGDVHIYAEPGKTPSRAWAVHKALYEASPDTKVVMHAHPFHIAAFCMSSIDFQSSIIPESYIVLRSVGRITFRQSLDPEGVVAAFQRGNDYNELLVDNDGVMIRGSSLGQVFDRLEVLEATANVVLECMALGELHPMTKQQTDEIDHKWFPFSKKRPLSTTYCVYKKRKTTNKYPAYALSEGAKNEPIPMKCLAFDDDSIAFSVRDGTRRPLGEYDIHIDMKYCGICHSDIHFAKNDIDNSIYPMCPGHELAGVAVKVGSKVTKFQVGDHIGVGCMVDSCLECRHCAAGDEQFCEKGCTLTYSSPVTHGRALNGPGMPEGTFGGYSTQMVVNERFAIKIPKDMPLEYAGPIMCAGVTTYDPLKYWKVKKGSRVGVIGLGGLGTMAIQLSKALGATVTAISRSYSKKGFAKKLGADNFVSMQDANKIKNAEKSLDLILDTVSKKHDIMSYQSMLDVNGKHVLIGLASDMGPMNGLPYVFSRKGIHGSFIGGIATTQEVMDLCSVKGIKNNIKVIGPKDMPGAYKDLLAGNSEGFRYVLDVKALNDAPVGLTLDPVNQVYGQW